MATISPLERASKSKVSSIDKVHGFSHRPILSLSPPKKGKKRSMMRNSVVHDEKGSVSEMVRTATCKLMGDPVLPCTHGPHHLQGPNLKPWVRVVLCHCLAKVAMVMQPHSCLSTVGTPHSGLCGQIYASSLRERYIKVQYPSTRQVSDETACGYLGHLWVSKGE